MATVDLRVTAQKALRLINSSTEFEYNGSEKYTVMITGGSGNGALVFSSQNGTGTGSIDSSGKFTFGSEGTVYVSVYKKGSTYQGVTYEQSKTLIIELELKNRTITVRVYHDVTAEIGEAIPYISPSNFIIENIIPTDTMAQTPTVYLVYMSDDFYDKEHRQIDINVEGEYPIAARYAQVPNKPGYNKKVKYRSKKLIYQNTKYYAITTYINDPSLGKVSVQKYYAKPKENVIFVASCTKGTYFIDKVASQGSGIAQSLYVVASSGSINYERVGTPEYDPTNVYHLTNGSYQFEMPSADVTVQCDLQSIASTMEGYAWPYWDIRPSHLTYNQDDYVAALKFVYYARSMYYNESSSSKYNIGLIPLGVYRPDFMSYNFYPFEDNPTSVRRSEIAVTLRRLSHGLRTYVSGVEELYFSRDYSSNWPAIWTYQNAAQSQPEETFKDDATRSNTPYARMFSYAGYDSSNQYMIHEEDYKDADGFPDTTAYNKALKESKQVQHIPIKSTFQYHRDLDSYPTSDYIFINQSIENTSLQHATIRTHEIFKSGDNAYLGRETRDVRDGYMQNYSKMADVAWSSWIGTVFGYDNYSAGTDTLATYRDATTILWRYAKFRQKEIRLSQEESRNIVYNSDNYYMIDGPFRWARAKGLLHDKDYQGNTINTDDPIPRPDFAYMIMRYCQIYGW